jgi:membrane-bound ClpP family serine protease
MTPAPLPTIEDIDMIPADAICSTALALTALLARLAIRQASVASQPPPIVAEQDVLLDADETAAYLQRSVSWIRRHGATKLAVALRQPGGKGTAARWSRRALTDWMNQ